MTNATIGMRNHSSQSVKQLIDYWAESQSEKTYLVDTISGATTSFGELQYACVALTHELHSKGLKKGDSIAYAMHNGTDAAKTILGIMYGGFLATAVNLVSGKTTISHVLDHSDAKLVLCQQKTVPVLEEALQSLKGSKRPPVLLEVSRQLFEQASDVFPIQTPSPTDDALLMYTSGTTGVPKGVLHSNSSILAGGRNTALAHQLIPDDRGLCVLPLYHINGLCVTLLGSLASGSSLVLPEKFSVSKFWNIIADHKCTWFSVVPTQISYLLHEAETNGHDPKGLQQLRFGRSASAPLSPDVQQAFVDKFQIPVIETMGLTETAAQILSNPINGVRKIGSPGIPFGNEIIIADTAQTELPFDTEGEVLVRGPNVMQQYRNNKAATDETITEDGWLRTGDLGRMDSDGYVYITGRLKELIIKGGENIAPREIDEALYTHPDVIEAAAFPRDCEQYGQKVEACVKIRDGSVLDNEALIKLCQDRVGSFKAPDQVHILPELPKGPSGKIQRLKLVELTR